MAAIRHKLSARPSSGTPSAFSTRGVVVLLKTFASIPPPDFGPSLRGALYMQDMQVKGSVRSPCIPNGPISHKHAVGVSVRKELQCRDSGFVQSVCRCVAFWAIAGLLESKRPPTWGPVGLQRRRSKSSARDDDGRTSAILLCSSEKLQCHQLQPEVAVKLKILKSRRNASLFGICAAQKENLIYCAVQHI
jgi:hypothetical protein